MKDEYAKILTKFSANPKYYNVTLLIGSLKEKGFLTESAVFHIERQKTLSEQRLELFNTLKRMQDSIVSELPPILRDNNCSDGAEFIEQELANLLPSNSTNSSNNELIYKGLRNVFAKFPLFDVGAYLNNHNINLNQREMDIIKNAKYSDEQQVELAKILANKGLAKVKVFYEEVTNKEGDISDISKALKLEFGF